MNESKNEDFYEVLLREFRDGKVVEANDQEQMKRITHLASLGLITKGMNFKTFEITAKTSPLGMKLIK